MEAADSVTTSKTVLEVEPSRDTFINHDHGLLFNLLLSTYNYLGNNFFTRPIRVCFRIHSPAMTIGQMKPESLVPEVLIPSLQLHRFSFINVSLTVYSP